MANEAYRPVWNAVDYAVRSGRLAPQPCEACGDSKTDGHHQVTAGGKVRTMLTGTLTVLPDVTRTAP
jgi:hypothetical protein